MKVHYALSLLLGTIAITTYSQESTPPALIPGHYIVVAAYLQGQASFANRYVADINKQGRHAQAGFDETRKLFYVYLDVYADFNESVKQMLKTRQEGTFPTAWVRVMKGGGGVTYPAAVQTTTPDPIVKTTEPVKEEKIVVKQEEIKTPVVVVPATDSVKWQPVAPTEVVDNPTAEIVYRPQVLKNTPVFLSLYNPTNNSVVEGEVEVIDTEKTKLISRVKGNDYLSLPNPNSKSGQLTLISTAFGYRKVQHEINYKSTEADTLQSYIALVGNYYMIKFDMVRIHRGDISPLYNVYFYTDAAVMKPESKYELNGLLQLMKEFPNYRIMLHGHTNGRSAGNLITRGESNDFFMITPDVKRGTGTAKALSRARAEVIRDWLVANGIAADRMEIKGWGGSRMIHDQNGDDARRNVRVDVEVIQE